MGDSTNRWIEIRWRFEGTRPISEIADKVARDVEQDQEKKKRPGKWWHKIYPEKKRPSR
jgi:hypothetical protein